MENNKELETDVLISLLKLIDNYKIIKDTKTNILEDHSLVIAARFLANECLIDENGNPNYTNIHELNKEGYRIFPGEVDSCGWLSGCIQIGQGIIVFG